ncbi:unnamed protein product [Echinostoma caproni]|uniref:WD_REPEATS_REGION domain-containing protein n=1 Tax=Echinostoma caproni TaxID=27848 RepID=A0A183AT22_9TREM|nr:unnamed protein product [Echinostoma caproni]
MSLWPAFSANLDPSRVSDYYYLAHISPNEDQSSGRVKGTDVEVIRLPDNVIVANTAMDSKGSTIAGLSNLGMCMALQGIPEVDGTPPGRCLLIAAFESGDMFLLARGKILARLKNALGEAVPIMSLAVLPVPYSNSKTPCMIALGGPSQETSTHTSARPLGFFSLLWGNSEDENDVKFISLRDKLPVRSCGTSSLLWRPDHRILAVGQWDGEIRLVETRYTDRWRVYHLGWLASLGAIDSGELLGDWAATTIQQPHGPIIDQQSTTVRALLFTHESHWLISAAPASAGAVGSLLVWDVYRTTNSETL